LLARINAAEPGNADAAALKARVVQTVKARVLGELRKKNLDAAEVDLRALLELAPEDASAESRVGGTRAGRERRRLEEHGSAQGRARRWSCCRRIRRCAWCWATPICR